MVDAPDETDGELLVTCIPEAGLLVTRANFDLVKECATFAEAAAKLQNSPIIPSPDSSNTAGLLIPQGSFVVQHSDFTAFADALGQLAELARRFADTPTYELSTAFLKEVEDLFCEKNRLQDKALSWFQQPDPNDHFYHVPSLDNMREAVNNLVELRAGEFLRQKVPMLVAAVNTAGHEVFREELFVDLTYLVKVDRFSARALVHECAEQALTRAKRDFLVEQLASVQEYLGVPPNKIERGHKLEDRIVFTTSVMKKSLDDGVAYPYDATISVAIEVDLPDEQENDIRHLFDDWDATSRIPIRGRDGAGSGRLFLNDEDFDQCCQAWINVAPNVPLFVETFAAGELVVPCRADAANGYVGITEMTMWGSTRGVRIDLIPTGEADKDFLTDSGYYKDFLTDRNYKDFLTDSRYCFQSDADRAAFETTADRVANLGTKEAQEEITALTFRRCPRFEAIIVILENSAWDLGWILEVEMATDAREVFEDTTVSEQMDFLVSKEYREYHDIVLGGAGAGGGTAAGGPAPAPGDVFEENNIGQVRDGGGQALVPPAIDPHPDPVTVRDALQIHLRVCVPHDPEDHARKRRRVEEEQSGHEADNIGDQGDNIGEDGEQGGWEPADWEEDHWEEAEDMDWEEENWEQEN